MPRCPQHSEVSAALGVGPLDVDFLALQLLRGNAESRMLSRLGRYAVLIANASEANVPPAQEIPSPVENEGAQAHGRSLHHIKL